MRSVDSHCTTQADRILNLLQAAWPTWTPAPQLAKISLQYSSRIFSLRRRGWEITNRVEIRNGTKCGYFRLGSPSLPRSSELRANRQLVADKPTAPPIDGQGGALFGEIAHERYPD